VKRENTPWCHVPESATVDEILSKLWAFTQETCSCGGKGPNDGGCRACQTWHYVTGTLMAKNNQTIKLIGTDSKLVEENRTEK